MPAWTARGPRCRARSHWLLEDKVAADRTGAEREHLLSALANIHRSASDLLDGAAHDDPGLT